MAYFEAPGDTLASALSVSGCVHVQSSIDNPPSPRLRRTSRQSPTCPPAGRLPAWPSNSAPPGAGPANSQGAGESLLCSDPCSRHSHLSLSFRSQRVAVRPGRPPGRRSSTCRLARSHWDPPISRESTLARRPRRVRVPGPTAVGRCVGPAPPASVWRTRRGTWAARSCVKARGNFQLRYTALWSSAPGRRPRVTR